MKPPETRIRVDSYKDIVEYIPQYAEPYYFFWTVWITLNDGYYVFRPRSPITKTTPPKARFSRTSLDDAKTAIDEFLARKKEGSLSVTTTYIKYP
jgi:hypothetical protein